MTLHKDVRILTFFIFAHLLGWTLVPAFIRYNLPLDAIEGAMWGQQFEWGYDKNPYMNGWLTGLVTLLSDHSSLMIYFLSQLSVVICFLYVWRLATNFFTPTLSLITVLLLECMQYYNFHAIDFNDNTLELSLWAMTIFYFYISLSSPTLLSWLLTAFAAALGMMTKYYTAILLVPLCLYFMFTKEQHWQLKTSKPYLALLLFCVILTPHLIWLFSHDFITLNYAIARTVGEKNWFNHLFYPLEFLWQQWQVFFPAFFIFMVFFFSHSNTKMTLRKQDKYFLLWAGLGPLFFTLFISFLFGIKLRAGWGMPLLSLWGMLLIAFFPATFTIKRIKLFIASIFLLLGIFLLAYIHSIAAPNTSSANFPGQIIANKITKAWQETYHTPLTYVAGSRWVGGNISFYSPHHPRVFVNFKEEQAPWVDLHDMKKKGAVFIWEMSEGETLPDHVRARFPELTMIYVQDFARLRQDETIAPVKLGIAFLPPQALKKING